MPAQTGYYDALKSVTGKVFSYLSSITLAGIDGKTLTVSENTSLYGGLMGTVNLGTVGPTQTKTVTVTLADDRDCALIVFSFYGQLSGSYGTLILSIYGYGGDSTLYGVTEVSRLIAGGIITVSTVTKGNLSFTFTVLSDHGALSAEVHCLYLSRNALSVAMA